MHQTPNFKCHLPPKTQKTFISPIKANMVAKKRTTKTDPGVIPDQTQKNKKEDIVAPPLPKKPKLDKTPEQIKPTTHLGTIRSVQV